MATTYTARDITVLEGLEPVRKRPGMYIGGVDSRGLHHLVWEIVDNAVDEVINGYATRIEVTLFNDGREIEVADNGRGIPVDIHPKYKKTALELILTTLHAGGKFEQGNYVHSGGLHGVGASVVNALSSEMIATVRRDGHEWQQTFAQGKATSKVTKISGSEKVRGSGTTVRFQPDAGDLRQARVRRRRDPRAPRGQDVPPPRAARHLHGRDEEARRARGARARRRLADYLTQVVARARQGRVARGRVSSSSAPRDPRIELALVWTEATDEHVRSYVNGIRRRPAARTRTA